MNNKTASILSGIASVLLLLSLVVGCVWVFCFNADFYKDSYSRLGTAEYVGVSEEKLFEATDTLLDYLENRRDDLNLLADDGNQYYNERETLHMIDVKNLYQAATCLGWIFLGVGAGILVVIFAFKKKNAFIPVLKGFFAAGAGVGIFFIVVAVFAAIDFNSFWINFHRLFFPMNDYWMLDEVSSRMIRMFELQFFFDLVTGILIMFLCIYAGLMIFAKIMINKNTRRVH